ncbi:MAG: N-acetyltransferase [Candidatus Anaerobiospirillum pullicola]|uniref:Amino-acid acetyltransferase n=1 Tax=Candidatus Anaerobiospirillum pullicola TaxID=2838451 RepID=A0A948THT1_9GAMM|nr:N-acetyltransferase [Candidatus Anaerobiospirillum pullicola]
MSTEEQSGAGSIEHQDTENTTNQNESKAVPRNFAPIPSINLNPDLFQGVSVDDLYQHAIKLHERNSLNTLELNKIAQALQEVQTILTERNQDNFTIRQARLSDIDSLYNMVNYWYQQGENLPRAREDIIRNIQSFAVCVRKGVVLGCACLYVYDSGLAEIRSLGVNPSIQRQGQGRSIVEFLLHRAQQYDIKKVFVLTRNPKFFAKVGFTLTTREALPEKILKDCEHCPKQDHCDEVAYEINL